MPLPEKLPALAGRVITVDQDLKLGGTLLKQARIGIVAPAS